MADWQCFCTTVNKPDARECWVCGLRRPDIPRAEAPPPAPAPARPRYPSPPPLPTAPAQASAPVPRAPSPRPPAPAPVPRAPSPRPSAPARVTQTQPKKKPPIDLTADSDDEGSPPKKPRVMEDASRRGHDDRPMYREAGVPKARAEELKRRRENENDRPLHRNVCREKVQDLEELRERQRAKYDHPQHIPADPRCWKNDVDKASHRIPPRKVFDGTKYFMNTLDEAITGPLAKSDRETLSPVDILWHTPFIQKALMTSYGVDYEFLAYLFRDSRLVVEPNLMTVVDNYDHSKNAPQVRQGTKEKPFRVVWPPFYDKHASSQVRERLKLATMHPKFWLLVFGDFLRVVVSSSNLGGYDNKMNNQFWVCDFPRRSGPMVQQATPEAEVDDRDAADARLKERIGAVKGDALIIFAKGDRSRVDVRGLDSDSRKAVHRWAEWRGGLATESRGEAHERTLRLTRTKGSNRHAKVTFASSLRGFVTEMLKGDDAAATSVREEWDDILQRHDLDSIADGVVFIPSTPGVRRGSLADCFGHRAIKRALRERGLKVARAEFANSSLGRLFDDRFLKCFRESIFGSPIDDGRLSIVWPTADVAMRMSRRLAVRAMTEDQGTAQMTGPHPDIWAKFKPQLKARFCRHEPPADRRTLHHSKILCLYDEQDTLIGVLGGSHNCSGAAWGVSEQDASVVMSFEAGVLIFCDKDQKRREDLERMLPWATPAPPYQGDDVPWHGDHLLNRLHAKGDEYARACAFSRESASHLPDLPLLKGAFPAHDKVQTLKIVSPCDVYAESLDEHTRKVCGEGAKKELRLRGVLHGNVFSRSRRPVKRLQAGMLVAVDGGQHKNYEYKHAVRGTVAIDEFRLVDGSGYVDTGVGSSKAVALVEGGEFDAKPCLGVFVERDQPAPSALIKCLSDVKVQSLLRDEFLGVWCGVGNAPGRLEHAECVCRKIFDVELKDGRGPALGAVVKGERVLVADQAETALVLESPSTFHAMLCDVIKKTEEALSTSVKDREEKRIKMEELPLQKAREAAQFVADNYDLLVIEPEGTLKAPGRVKLWREPPSAAEKARLADDTSRQIGTRDAFYGDLVPFLAALRENHSVPISFATVFGQKCTDPEPRGRAKEDRVRSALDDLVARLQAEAPGYREDDIDILIAWRCSKAHLSNYSAEKAQEALRGLALPSASESERALSGGVHALAVKLVEEGPAGPVRRAAEWSPSFAEDGLYLQAAVARHREAFELIGAPRTLVIGADHAHKLAARLAGFDYIEEKYLAFGALAEKKVVKPDAPEELEEVVDFG